MPTFALPSMLQLRLHLFSANGLRQGVSRPFVMLPLVEPQMCRAIVTATPGQASQRPQPSCLPPGTAIPEPSLPQPGQSCSAWFLEVLSAAQKQPMQVLRLPSIILPEELQDPAAWDAFLSKLTSPPTQHATQLPTSHTAQPPVCLPTASINLSGGGLTAAGSQWQVRRPARLHFRAAALCQAGAHPRGSSTSSLAGALPCRALQCSFQHGASASVV